MEDDAHLERLRKHIRKQPAYIARNSKGRLVKKWNLLVPSQVLDLSWEEIS